MIKIPDEFYPPTQEVLNMKKQGFQNQQINSELQNRQYNPQEISSAINQADVKQSVDPSMQQLQESAPDPQGAVQQMPVPQAPAPQPIAQPQYQQSFSLPPSPRGPIQEQIEELSESIINEKWEDLIAKLGDINIWKETVRNEITSMKQEIIRINHRFENLQNAILGRVNEYNRSIQDMGADIKALEKVLEKIVTPLTTNIRELQNITEKLKGAK